MGIRVTVSVLALALVLAAGRMQAGQYNPTLSIGDPGPAWQELPGIDGRQHALSDLKDAEVVVVVFTCNSCPYAVDYEDRIAALAAEYAGVPRRVALVAINVNRVAEDLLPQMKIRAGEKKFAFPYLYDESQQIARAYGATNTPEFFVLDRNRRVVYMGAMDDSPDATKVSAKYVEQAIEAALAGRQPTVQETVSIGCAIRYVSQRRGRSGR